VFPSRVMHPKPTWLIDVSTACTWRRERLPFW
jgi:hypothetical protein